MCKIVRAYLTQYKELNKNYKVLLPLFLFFLNINFNNCDRNINRHLISLYILIFFKVF